MVKPRLVSKSIGCCKNFKGPDALATRKDVQYWISELAAEIIERIRDDFVVVSVTMLSRYPTTVVAYANLT